MSDLDKRIPAFINDHHLLTVATSQDGKPWVASCFYIYLPERNCFVFTTDIDTRHGGIMANNSHVALNIALETKVVGQIKGLQIEGVASIAEGDIKREANRAYLKAYPYALLMKTTLWIVEPTFMKLTDNLLGFGKKLTWEI